MSSSALLFGLCVYVCVSTYTQTQVHSFATCFICAYHHIISCYSPQENKVEKFTRLDDVCTCVRSCPSPQFFQLILVKLTDLIHFLLSFSTLYFGLGQHSVPLRGRPVKYVDFYCSLSVKTDPQKHNHKKTKKVKRITCKYCRSVCFS